MSTIIYDPQQIKKREKLRKTLDILHFALFFLFSFLCSKKIFLLILIAFLIVKQIILFYLQPKEYRTINNVKNSLISILSSLLIIKGINIWLVFFLQLFGYQFYLE